MLRPSHPYRGQEGSCNQPHPAIFSFVSRAGGRSEEKHALWLSCTSPRATQGERKHERDTPSERKDPGSDAFLKSRHSLEGHIIPRAKTESGVLPSLAGNPSREALGHSLIDNRVTLKAHAVIKAAARQVTTLQVARPRYGIPFADCEVCPCGNTRIPTVKGR
jgi:hypothetical protein